MTATLEAVGERLRALQNEHGLLSAALVGLDGLLIAGAATEGVDLDALAAVAAPGLLMMGDLASELGEGLAQVTTMEYPNHTVLLAPVNDDTLFIAIAEASTMNLGQLRIIVRRALNDLQADLGTA